MIRKHAKKYAKKEAWFDSKQIETIQEPALDVILNELNKHDQLFDTVSKHGNEIVMHLDDEDADLKISCSGTKCEASLVFYVGSKNIETYSDVKRFVDNIIKQLR